MTPNQIVTTFVVLTVAYGLLWGYTLIDILRNEYTGSNKIIWLVLVFFIPGFGLFFYQIIGKKQKIEVVKPGKPVQIKSKQTGPTCPQCGLDLHIKNGECEICGYKFKTARA